MRNFGKKSLDEIKERLAARGLIEAPEPSEASAGSDGTEDTQSEDVEDTTGDDEMVAGEER
jgi:hypothetical protein